MFSWPCPGSFSRRVFRSARGEPGHASSWAQPEVQPSGRIVPRVLQVAFPSASQISFQQSPVQGGPAVVGSLLLCASLCCPNQGLLGCSAPVASPLLLLLSRVLFYLLSPARVGFISLRDPPSVLLHGFHLLSLISAPKIHARATPRSVTEILGFGVFCYRAVLQLY